jgi:cell wall-associated NlpC family hydrolase
LRCAVAVAAIRAEPRDDAEQVTQALAGEPIEVERVEGDWAFARTAYGYPGWIRSEALEDGSGEIVADADGPAVDVARSYLGAPYLWGGMTIAGIDCSGLVHMAYRRLGRLVPRDSHQQEAAGPSVDEPRPGDLVTYGGEERADHVAFWLGDGRILHSTGRDGGVGVVEEDEPPELRLRRRSFVRLDPGVPAG